MSMQFHRISREEADFQIFRQILAVRSAENDDGNVVRNFEESDIRKFNTLLRKCRRNAADLS